jgi:hypothetical protein
MRARELETDRQSKRRDERMAGINEKRKKRQKEEAGKQKARTLTHKPTLWAVSGLPFFLSLLGGREI